MLGGAGGVPHVSQGGGSHMSDGVGRVPHVSWVWLGRVPHVRQGGIRTHVSWPWVRLFRLVKKSICSQYVYFSGQWVLSVRG